MNKRTMKLAAGALLGNMAAEAFILKEAPNDAGLVDVAPGFGLDDIVRAGCIVAGIMIVEKVL